ncbi:hypothetical protein [Methylobacterium fujisawaense]|uniref:hypothetical protein n=1 Tax=Methylobacterium fujisawaense TaxID=107400 RepID=UPI00313EA4E5
MAASDYVPKLLKYRLHLQGRPQMTLRTRIEGLLAAAADLLNRRILRAQWLGPVVA